MGKYAVPEEIRKLKPKGTMVKCISGKYYVYEYFCRKNDLGKWVTKMGKIVGSIDKEIGFIPNDTHNTDEEITTLEYGQYALALANSRNTIQKLLTVFNVEDAYCIYLMAIIHFVNGFTYLKNVQTYVEQSYLSVLFPSLKLGYRSLASLLDSLGRKQNRVMQFEQLLLNESSKEIAFDGHVIRSTSHENDLGEYGNKFMAIKDMQINVLMAYDIQTNQPILSRVYEGGALDKISIKDVIARHTFENTLFIVDRGFYSNENITLFSQNNNHYIIPLSPNLKTYKEATQDMKLDELFVYERSKKVSTIEYKEVILKNGKRVIVYRDVNQNALERADYVKNMKNDNVKYTKEQYEKVKDFFGVIILETNLNESVDEVFARYKKRWKIETFFNYFKNNIEYSALKLSDYYLTQGLSFIMLIVGMIYKEFNEAMPAVQGKSIDDCLLEARFLKAHKLYGTWKITNIKKSLRELMESLNVDLLKG